MSSIISIISFFILLLATFSYSVPIGKTYGNSTVNNKYTTNQRFVNQGVPVNISLTSSNQTTNVSIIYPDQSSEGSNSNEVTTWGVTRSPRTSVNGTDSSEFEDLSEGSYEESSVPSSTQINQKRAFEEPSFSSESESSEKRSYEQSSVPSPIQTNQKRAFEEPSFSSESESTEKRSSEESAFPSTNNINKKPTLYRSPSNTVAQKPRSFANMPSYATPATRTGSYTTTTGISNTKRAVEDFLYTTLESSTEFNQRAIRPFTSTEEFETSTSFYPQNQTEVTTYAEPTSSVETFGQYTGLFTTEQSTTSDYETTESPFPGSGLTKTVSVIPGKITEARIYGNSPNQYIQPVEQLSQVHDQ